MLTSGGDAPGMNAAVRAVVRAGHARDMEVIGIRRGYAGMIQGEFEPLGPRSVANTIQRGGTILLTARSKVFMSAEGRAQAAGKLREAGIEGIVAIGGNGTFQGATLLAAEHGIPTVGVPGTIDNDLFGTDRTIGYDTAVNTALDAIDKIRDTAASHERLFFVEVMGRHAGFIALDVGIAGGAEEVVIPEAPVSAEELADICKGSLGRGKASSIIVVAEGVQGGAYALMQRVMELTGMDARMSILGHIQRGGSPTAQDRILASRLGHAAVDALAEGRHGVMVGVCADEIVHVDLRETWEKRKDVSRQLYAMAKTLTL